MSSVTTDILILWGCLMVAVALAGALGYWLGRVDTQRRIIQSLSEWAQNVMSEEEIARIIGEDDDDPDGTLQ